MHHISEPFGEKGPVVVDFFNVTTRGVLHGPIQASTFFEVPQRFMRMWTVDVNSKGGFLVIRFEMVRAPLSNTIPLDSDSEAECVVWEGI